MHNTAVKNTEKTKQKPQRSRTHSLVYLYMACGAPTLGVKTAGRAGRRLARVVGSARHRVRFYIFTFYFTCYFTLKLQ